MTTNQTMNQTNTKNVSLIAAAVLAVAVAIAVIIALTAGGSDEPVDSAASSISRIPTEPGRQVSAATISTDALPRFEAGIADAGTGMSAPVFTASYFDDTEVTIDPADGTARIIVFLAHWCPHCQAEVKAITEWATNNDVPDGVEIVAISTGVDQGSPNYPPSAWLARESWPFMALRDSAPSDLASAYGLSSFPYLVAVDDSGTVVSRSAGQLPEGQWDALIASLSSR